MLLLLIEYLQKMQIKIPSVFFYASTRMILAAITSLVLTIFCGPWFIRKLYSLKIGQQIRSNKECPLLAELHSKKKNTPTMGGILILFSMLISLLLWMDLKNIFTVILLFTTVSYGLLGSIDDYLKLAKKNSKGLKPKFKFLAQFIIALIIISSIFFVPSKNENKKKNILSSPMVKEQVEGNKIQTLTMKQYLSKIYVPFFKKAIVEFKGPMLIILFAFFLFIIVGTSNAVNLTDGLDGLASGCLVMVSSVLAIFAFMSNNILMAKYLNILYIEGSGEIAIFLFSLSGSLLGFLWYNSYPAQIFMGDTGSLSLGGIIGVAAILLRREFLLSIIGGIFVIEALSVILQVFSYKFRNKKRIFLCSPLHHHFEYKGWSEQKVVIRFWIIGLLLAIVGIASLKFQ